MCKTLVCLIGILFCSCVNAYCQPVTVFVPSKPYIENLPPDNKKLKGRDEVDVLMSLMQPYKYRGIDMDRPSFFAVVYYPVGFEPDAMQPELSNLLGDVEEIRYLKKKAWGANVGISKPGLYEYVLEAKPWWDEKKGRFLHQQAKVLLPVQGADKGWDHSFGQSFEILPLTRPFGLGAPSFFSARVLLDGKPLETVSVVAGRINADHLYVASPWQRTLEAKTDALGQFGFVFNEPGWWYCEARIEGQPLKGPDGEMRPLDRSTLIWIYLDGAVKIKK